MKNLYLSTNTPKDLLKEIEERDWRAENDEVFKIADPLDDTRVYEVEVSLVGNE
jgi:hypothetical protein